MNLASFRYFLKLLKCLLPELKEFPSRCTLSPLFWHPASQGTSSKMESCILEKIGTHRPGLDSNSLGSWVWPWLLLILSVLSHPFRTVLRNKPKASGTLSEHLPFVLYLQTHSATIGLCGRSSSQQAMQQPYLCPSYWPPNKFWQ